MWTVIKKRLIQQLDLSVTDLLPLHSSLYFSTNEVASISRQFSEAYGVTTSGSSCWKDAVNQCLEAER